jgi:response regulator RpfG family c-di-GMP phosphodiesterase
VDDDRNILSSFQRQFHSIYETLIAENAYDGLKIIEMKGPVAVVVSDYRMPEMNGVEFLTRVREISPDTVRFMLTGQADMEAVIKVINEGRIFRLLTKPCLPDLMKKNIEDGIDQYKLIINTP